MRQILPTTFPGKRLEDCQGLELLQLGIIRYTERHTHESRLTDGFISDGSSLHEWVYGKIRVHMGIHPKASSLFRDDLTGEDAYLEQVIDALGAVVQRHARSGYDLFLHLPIEFPLVADGHRPVSERFRELSDQLLMRTLADTNIPTQIVGGGVEERVEKVLGILGVAPVISIDDAIRMARTELDLINSEPSETNQ